MGMTEAQTRASLIDKQLLASAWGTNNYIQAVKEFLVSTKKDKNTFCDYVLSGHNKFYKSLGN